MNCVEFGFDRSRSFGSARIHFWPIAIDRPTRIHNIASSTVQQVICLFTMHDAVARLVAVIDVHIKFAHLHVQTRQYLKTSKIKRYRWHAIIRLKASFGRQLHCLSTTNKSQLSPVDLSTVQRFCSPTARLT
jgi:hypothetical protein